jgi:hypothetical protein
VAVQPTSCYNFHCAEEQISFFAWDREFQDLWLEKGKIPFPTPSAN